MVFRRVFKIAASCFLLLACTEGLAEQAVSNDSDRAYFSDRSFHDNQWIYFNGVNVNLPNPLASQKKSLFKNEPTSKTKSILKYKSLQVDKNVLNFVAGIVGVGMGLGHAYMEEDEAKVFNFLTLSLGMSSMMNGIQGLKQSMREPVAIKGIDDVGQTSFSSKGMKIYVRPAVSLDSSVGFQIKAKF